MCCASIGCCFVLNVRVDVFIVFYSKLRDMLQILSYHSTSRAYTCMYMYLGVVLFLHLDKMTNGVASLKSVLLEVTNSLS